MPSVAFGTIVANNYLSYARVLARSFKEHHPDIPLFLLLCDRVDGAFDATAEEFQLVLLDDLGISNLQQLRFRYSRQQLVAAAKPSLLRHLLDSGFERAIYIDADILVLNDLTPVLRALEHSSILLTPHLLSPLTGEQRAARELNILRSGVYNGGFLGVANTPTAHRFLSWWQNRLSVHCRHDIPRGMHLDQRWIDLVPALFDDFAVLRDAASNVAYWNLPERNVEVDGERVLIDGRPCRFFHFSGFSPDAPQRVTRHCPSLTMNDVAAAAPLFARYAALLRAAGFQETTSLPYAYGFFDNGAPIPDVARELYAELDGVEAFGDPFAAAQAGSYFHFLVGGVDALLPPRRRISRFWHAVYRHRPDVQNAFPDYFDADRQEFLKWTVISGGREHGVSDCPLAGDGSMTDRPYASEERFREVLNQIETFIERRYEIPVVRDVTGPLNQSCEDALFLITHLFGHTVLWNTDPRARAIGELRDDERKACQYSLQLFHDAGIRDLDQWMADFAACDSGYLAHFHRTGEKRPFREFWSCGMPKIEPLTIPEFQPARWVSRALKDEG